MEKARAFEKQLVHYLKQMPPQVMGLESVDLVAYEMVHSNNADLPGNGYFIQDRLPDLSDHLPEMGIEISFDELFASSDLVLAPTQHKLMR